jgi:hypothetical protein
MLILDIIALDLLAGITLEEVHELFQVFRICAKGVTILYGLVV